MILQYVQVYSVKSRGNECLFRKKGRIGGAGWDVVVETRLEHERCTKDRHNVFLFRFNAYS